MSMSQEEIEALMSGAGDVSLEADEEVSSQENNSEESESEAVVEDTASEVVTEGTDEEVAEAEEAAEAVAETVIENEESSADDSESTDEDFSDVLAGIDGLVDDEKPAEPKEEPKEESIEDLIDQNQYPLPVKNENKVVNQLNQVADDSEEKASQIFDVLSFILDENNEIANYNKSMGEFIQREAKLLNALTTKFPNIQIFKTNLETATELLETTDKLSSKLNDENNKIFEAMELMQYHDINRQKIERVMAVIRKLNSYLNGIFEDESEKAEVQIAKHISGDSNEIVEADDLEALISQFSKEEQ